METEYPLFHAQMALFYGAMALGPFCKSAKKVKQIAGQAASLLHTAGPEVIDGVLFDFRDPHLDPGEWGLATIVQAIMNVPGMGSDGPARDTPSIWFPWFGKFNFTSYSKRIDAHHNSDLMRSTRANCKSEMATKYTRPELDEIIKANRPKYFVNIGDAIRIRSVVNQMLGDNVANKKLEHDHDSIVKEVTLEILRENGDLEIIECPFIVTGNQALISQDSEYTDYVMNILWRMVSFFKIDGIDQLSGVARDQSIYSRAAVTGIDLYNTLDPLSDLQYDGSEEGEGAKLIINIANQAAMLGFLWAKAEAETNLKPLATSALQRKDFNIKGGKRSGVERRKIAENGWKRTAKQLAFEIRAKRPSLSQDRLVMEINDAWKSKIAAPQFPTLKKYISHLEKNEGLPAKSRKPSKALTLVAAE